MKRKLVKVIMIILFTICIFLNAFLDPAYEALVATTDSSNFDVPTLSVAELRALRIQSEAMRGHRRQFQIFSWIQSTWTQAINKFKAKLRHANTCHHTQSIHGDWTDVNIRRPSFKDLCGRRYQLCPHTDFHRYQYPILKVILICPALCPALNYSNLEW